MTSQVSKFAVACDIDIFNPTNIVKSLRGDDTVCGRKNPEAFRKLRNLLIMLYDVEGRSLDSLGEDELGVIVDEVIHKLAALRGVDPPGGLERSVQRLAIGSRYAILVWDSSDVGTKRTINTLMRRNLQGEPIMDRRLRLLGRFGCIGTLLALPLGCSSPDQDAEVAALTIGVAQVERMDVPLSVEMVGATHGTQDVPIRARVEGFLETMSFVEGSFVKKGDPLYSIDPQPFQARLVEAQSLLAAAQTTHVKTQSDLARIRPLAEMNAVSQQDLDGAVAQEAAASAGVRAAEAQVELAEIELSYSRITAPIDGLIGISQAKPGEFVGREPNPVVLNVRSDLHPIRVRFSISEREYLVLARTYLGEMNRNLAQDQRDANLILLLADGSEHPHTGIVVATAQAVNAETGTYSVEAAFPNPNNLLLPGQFARVRAPYHTLEDVPVVPRRAIVELQGLYQIYVVDDNNTVAVRTIELGPVMDNVQVVESGLEGGETIVVEGVQRVRTGTLVNPQPFVAPVVSSPADSL